MLCKPNRACMMVWCLIEACMMVWCAPQGGWIEHFITALDGHLEFLTVKMRTKAVEEGHQMVWRRGIRWCETESNLVVYVQELKAHIL